MSQNLKLKYQTIKWKKKIAINIILWEIPFMKIKPYPKIKFKKKYIKYIKKLLAREKTQLKLFIWNH